MKTLSTILALAVALTVAGNLSAGEKKKRPRPERPKRQMFGPMHLFKGLDLGDEQKEKFAELRKQYEPKLKDVAEKLRGILTDEQKQARAEAAKAAKEAGKKGKEFRQAVRDAIKLTDEQKEKFAEARKEMRALYKEIREKSLEILTPEQKKMLKEKMQRRREEMKKHRKGKPREE